MAHDEDVLQEIELLQAIYMDELSLHHSTINPQVLERITVDIHPATANDTTQQYVRARLTIHLHHYPRLAPQWDLGQVRGLNDAQITELTKLVAQAANRSSDPEGDSDGGGYGGVLHNMIQTAKDYLTRDNRPSDTCAICLHGFPRESQDNLVRTEPCYHYFHKHCFSRYIHFALTQLDKEREEDEERVRLGLSGGDDGGEGRERGVVCPVCRCLIEWGMWGARMKDETGETEDEEIYEVDNNIRKVQTWLEMVYTRQKAVGGVIGTDDEKQASVLQLSTVESEPQTMSQAESTTSCQPPPPPPPPQHDQGRINTVTNERKGLGRGRHYAAGKGRGHVGGARKYRETNNTYDQGERVATNRGNKHMQRPRHSSDQRVCDNVVPESGQSTATVRECANDMSNLSLKSESEMGTRNVRGRAGRGSRGRGCRGRNT